MMLSPEACKVQGRISVQMVKMQTTTSFHKVHTTTPPSHNLKRLARIEPSRKSTTHHHDHTADKDMAPSTDALPQLLKVRSRAARLV